MKTSVLIVSVFFVFSVSCSQVFMDADNTGDAYARIESKGYGYEVPDCIHPVRHITEEWDSEARKYVFVFYSHKSIDNDRCINFDRQRTEIKTWSSSPDSMIVFFGETQTYRWKFKLNAGFQPSSNFTHIHQIKSGDGTYDTDNPLLTITPRKSSPNQLEIRFTYPIEEGGNTEKLMSVELATFLGIWIEAYESAKYDSNSHGTYSLQLKRLRDDSLLLSYSNSAISMWRTGITFCRPKYGIYRSLLDSNSLRDEAVRFADFYLKKGTKFDLPSAPTGLNASAASENIINLTWNDNSNNEGQFRIDRSSNGTTWSYLAAVKAGAAGYSDTGLIASTAYYYRIRAENTYGNSSFSNIIAATTKGTNDVGYEQDVPTGFGLTCYPNPFNPATMICFQIPAAGKVSLKIYDQLGMESATLIDGIRPAGQYQLEWDAAKYPSGVYLCRLQMNEYRLTKKLLLLK